MSELMSERMRNLVVGATAMAGMVAGLYLLMLFGYLPGWLEGGYEVRVRMGNASGLTEGSRVRLSGIDIGRVTSVMHSRVPPHGVVIVARVDDAVRIPAGVRVEAQSPLLGGNPSLAFDVGNLSQAKKNQVLPNDGTAVIDGEALTLASQFAGELEAAIRGPAGQFEKLVDRFDRLSVQWALVGERINELLETRSLERVDSGQVGGNVSSVVARVDQRLAEFKRVIEGLDGWVNDEQLRQDVRATVANARRLSEHGDQAVRRLEQRYTAVADDLMGVIGATRAVIDTAQAGDGTIGKLFHDPSLYDNLNDTVERLQQSLDEFRLLVQKWKAEGLPVQF